MKNLRFTTLLTSLAAALTIFGSTAHAQKPEQAKPVKVDLEKCVIISTQPNNVTKYAVEELQAHIKLVSGIDVPAAKKFDKEKHKGMFPIFVGIKPPDDTKEFASEEARWRLTANKGIYLYGKDRDAPSKKKAAPMGYKEVALSGDSEAGTLFAVYEFLEGCLGIIWMEPGPNGTAYVPMKSFTYVPNEGAYIPQLIQRHMRTAYKADLRARALQNDIPQDMQFTDSEFTQRADDEYVWRRRMRMGKPTVDFTYGHAFTKWWDKYGDTNPEYFALNKNGKRAPIAKGNADRIKMCVSNPALIKQIVADHFATNPNKLVINGCENDSRAFCTCDKCKALDVVLPGEENLEIDDRHLTDRYVYFVNAILREARTKYNPKTQVAFYFYSRYNEPPRREKLSDGAIIFLLPNLGDTFDYAKYCEDWKNAGAKTVFLRPNDLNQDTGFPHGFEEKMFSKYKIANNNIKVIGTDFDTCFGFWPVSGEANYILARAFYKPDREFQNWHREYCSAYGAAAPDMDAYYTYWRGIWNNRITPNLDKISELTEGYKLLRSKLMHLTDLLYTEEDFDKTDAILATALTRKLTPWQKAKIENMQLANQHTRLKYRAVCANRMCATATPEEQKQTAQALYDFRRKHRLDLNIHWELMMYLENAYEDNAGLKRLLGTESERLYKWRLSETEKLKAARGDYNTPLR